MSQLHTDRNLFYAVLAVQMEFVSAHNLIQAMNAWMLAKSKPIGQILLEQQMLSPDQHEKIEELVRMRFQDFSTAEKPKGPDQEETRYYPQPAPLPPPMRYRIRHKHNEGGLGEIFLAYDEELKREIALKQIKTKYAKDLRSRQRFRIEAEITGRLEHPCIVPVHGLGEDGAGQPYYAMRLIRGKTLKSAIAEFFQAEQNPERDRAERALAFRGLLRNFLDICNAVAYAHSRGVIHRDLKPSNVMLGPYGETLVLDWGLAKLMEEVETPDPERSQLRVEALEESERSAGGAVIGSPAYMAPEQAQGRTEEVSIRTDIYLLGGVLFEILTGQPPHPRAHEYIRCPDPPHPREVLPTVPVALDGITARCMAPRQEDRFQQVQDLVREVERWLADEPIVAYQALVAGFRDLSREQPDNKVVREQLAEHLVSLGIVLGGMNRPSDSYAIFNEAIREYESLVNSAPHKPRHRADLANVQVHFSRALRQGNRVEEAAEMGRAAVRTYQWLILTDPQSYNTNLANAMLSLTGEPIPAPATREITPEEGLHTIYPTPPPRSEGGDTVPLETPSRLTIIRELGRGGSGSVLLARDNNLNREVVLKQLRLNDPTNVRRFLQEAELLGLLEHPNIVPVYGMGYRSDGLPFIIMRYQTGEQLSRWIDRYHANRQNEEVSLPFLLRAFLRICEAVSFAHSKGVIHRDPKPANVLVSAGGEVSLLDWGLAKRLDQPLEEGDAVPGHEPTTGLVTGHGTVMGTPAYMAPEMARGESAAVDRRTDVYILGATLYHIVTGKPPFAGPNPVDILMHVIGSEVPPARSLLPSVSPGLEAICSKALAKDPDQRYQQVDALAQDVKAWLDGQRLAADPRSFPVRWFRYLFGRRV
jgi:serine/threonine protein kinase